MAIQVEVPPLGESVKQATLVHWHKADGAAVKIDEPLCELETDKANVDVPSPGGGVLRHVAQEGDTVSVGETIARIDAAGVAAAAPAPGPAGQNPAAAPAAATAGAAGTSAGRGGAAADFKPEDYSPSVRVMLEEHRVDPRALQGSGPGGRLTKEDVEAYLARRGPADNGRSTAGSAATPRANTQGASRSGAAPGAATATGGRPSVVEEAIERGEAAEEAPPGPAPEGRQVPPAPVKKDIATAKPASDKPTLDFDAHGERRTPMSKIRLRIAETLVNAQHTAAILTTFNEVDMSAIMALRAKYKERFAEAHGIGLGFMSFFAKAVAHGLKEFPRVNASIDGTDIIYRQYVHLGVAVSTDRGLVVPVLRNVQDMSFARVEGEIKRLAGAARDGKLGLAEMTGATFTVTNGGIFGSLLSTPILTPPQSGILGMHAIQQRPVAVDGKVEIRPMMYLALSYDHRLVDGRESVSFLVRLKQSLEDPARLMLEI